MSTTLGSKPRPACTCGAKSVNSPFHSPWCDGQPKDEVTDPVYELQDNGTFMTDEEMNNLLAEIDRISGETK